MTLLGLPPVLLPPPPPPPQDASNTPAVNATAARSTTVHRPKALIVIDSVSKNNGDRAASARLERTVAAGADAHPRVGPHSR
jgi:prophage tail gpP-like protein